MWAGSDPGMIICLCLDDIKAVEIKVSSPEEAEELQEKDIYGCFQNGEEQETTPYRVGGRKKDWEK